MHRPWYKCRFALVELFATVGLAGVEDVALVLRTHHMEIDVRCVALEEVGFPEHQPDLQVVRTSLAGLAEQQNGVGVLRDDLC